MFKKIISAAAAMTTGAITYKLMEKTNHPKAAPLVGAVVSAATYNVVSQTLTEKPDGDSTEDIPLDSMADFIGPDDTEKPIEQPAEVIICDPKVEEPSPNVEEHHEEIEEPYPDENMDAPEETEVVEDEPSLIENREEFVSKFIEAADKGEQAVQQFIDDLSESLEAMDSEEEPVAKSIPAFQEYTPPSSEG